MRESRAGRRRSWTVRAGRLAGIALLALAQSGCILLAGGAAVGGVTGAAIASTRPAPVTGLGSAVDVTLDPPRDLTIEGGVAGDSAWVRGTRSAVGRITGLRGDTLWLALAEVVGSRGPATFPAVLGPTAVVVRGPGVSVRVIARRPTVATATWLGAALGLIATVVGIYAFCYTHRCTD